MVSVGRNQSCPCGSGKKHKVCCGKAAIEPKLTQLMACLVQHLGGEVAIGGEMIRSMPEGLGLLIKQDGDAVVISLVQAKPKNEHPDIVVPEEKKIIT